MSSNIGVLKWDEPSKCSLYIDSPGAWFFLTHYEWLPTTVPCEWQLCSSRMCLVASCQSRHTSLFWIIFLSNGCGFQHFYSVHMLHYDWILFCRNFNKDHSFHCIFSCKLSLQPLKASGSISHIGYHWSLWKLSPVDQHTETAASSHDTSVHNIFPVLSFCW